MDRPDNPPAFPRQATFHGARLLQQEHDGQTLLEVYAGQAMQGMLASPQLSGHSPSKIAEAAFNVAAAMLVEREKKLQERTLPPPTKRIFK